MTRQTSSVVVLIPARNEEATVGDVVRKVRSTTRGEVVVIDDVSDDATIKEARAAGAGIIPLAVHLGAWGAMQAGMRYALKNGYQIAVTMDADGQHPAPSIPELVEPIQSGEADVVIGACTERGSRARHMAWKIFRRISGVELRDLTSGFRAYNRTAMTVLASRQGTLLDYQDMGVLILLQRSGLQVLERPVAMCPRAIGTSRIFSSWWMVLKYMLSSTVLCIAKR